MYTVPVFNTATQEEASCDTYGFAPILGWEALQHYAPA